MDQTPVCWPRARLQHRSIRHPRDLHDKTACSNLHRGIGLANKSSPLCHLGQNLAFPQGPLSRNSRSTRNPLLKLLCHSVRQQVNGARKTQKEDLTSSTQVQPSFHSTQEWSCDYGSHMPMDLFAGLTRLLAYSFPMSHQSPFSVWRNPTNRPAITD